MYSQFSPIDYGRRYVVFDAPSEDNADIYAKKLKGYRVQTVVRACGPSFDPKVFEDQGIRLVDLWFKDGGFPSGKVIDRWKELLATVPVDQPIGVYCLVGLGRAPTLVAIALIEAGLPPAQAVLLIRDRRPKCFNNSQLDQILNYKRKESGTCCIC